MTNKRLSADSAPFGHTMESMLSKPWLARLGPVEATRLLNRLVYPPVWPFGRKKSNECKPSLFLVWSCVRNQSSDLSHASWQLLATGACDLQQVLSDS